jgi:hypothetical protein
VAWDFSRAVSVLCFAKAEEQHGEGDDVRAPPGSDSGKTGVSEGCHVMGYCGYGPPQLGRLGVLGWLVNGRAG